MVCGSKIHQQCLGIVVQSLVEMSTKEPYLAIARKVHIHRPASDNCEAPSLWDWGSHSCFLTWKGSGMWNCWWWSAYRILVSSLSGSQKRITSWTAWLWRSRHCSPSNTGIYPKTASHPRRYRSVLQLLCTHAVSKLSRYSYQIYKWKISVCIGMYFCFILWWLT